MVITGRWPFGFLLAAVSPLLIGCVGPAATPGPATPIELGTPPVRKHDSQSARVLVVINRASPEGIAIGTYYQAARGIPDSNVVMVTTTLDDDISDADWVEQIRNPVAAKLETRHGIDFLVTTHGIPLRAGARAYAVDMLLAGVALDLAPIQAFTSAEFTRATSPYYRKDEPFSHAKFGLYLTTRLDGYSIDDMKGLVDRSVSAKPENGLFFFDQPVFDRVGINDQLETAMERRRSWTRGSRSWATGAREATTPTIRPACITHSVSEPGPSPKPTFRPPLAHFTT